MILCPCARYRCWLKRSGCHLDTSSPLGTQDWLAAAGPMAVIHAMMRLNEF